MSDEPCQCAYCRSGGMSATGAECVERMAEVVKRLREELKGTLKVQAKKD